MTEKPSRNLANETSACEELSLWKHQCLAGWATPQSEESGDLDKRT